jgi:hypothetical protein
MAKKAPELDTPFKTGEQVMVARAARGVPEGAVGKVRLVNGLEGYDGGDPWIRYWVRFEDHGLVGHVTHQDLVRPFQYGEWLDREEARVKAEMAAASGEAEAATDAAPAAGGGDGGVASLIPANILERSKAAKARLLGA